jgi:protein-S-isoprenylcysteine O-methyltransferase Ste14
MAQALQALLAFLALPGLVAFLLPALFARSAPRPSGLAFLGLVPFGLGVVGLLACVREFYVRGRGTLAPWAPPKHLVTTGLYRHSRNPMYVSVLLILAGWGVLFERPALWVYAGVVAVAFHIRVVVAEEPWQQREFGAEWTDYKARVPRWLGRGRL